MATTSLLNRYRLFNAIDWRMGSSAVTRVRRVYREELSREPSPIELRRALWLGGGWEMVGHHKPDDAYETREELKELINPPPPPSPYCLGS